MPFTRAIINVLRRIIAYAFLFCLLLLSCDAAEGAELTVAVLKTEGNFPSEDILTGFKAEMQQNSIPVRLIVVEGADNVGNISAQIARMKPDVLLCIGAKALEHAAPIKNIPKIYCMVTYENAQAWSDKSGFYGVSLDIAPLTQFRIIRQAMPVGKRIGVLYDPEHNRKLIEEARRAAAATGFTLVALPVRTIRDIPAALDKLENNVDLLWTIYDQTAYTPESTRYILLQTLRKKIPIVGLSPNFAKAGALLAIYGNYVDLGQQIALQAIALSRGAEPPPQISRPRKALIAVNEKVGRIMNIDFSSQFMKQVQQTY